MSIIYNISIYFYLWLIKFAAFFNPKANLWISGRKDWKQKLESATRDASNIIWFHAASLGEFEQGRPLIEKIRAEQKDIFILLTFFSPSGYEVRKDYDQADYICYLPADTSRNAKDFISIVQPKQAFFIKYEFWYNYLSELKAKAIPLYLISGIFRPQHIFFKSYGQWFLKQLTHFDKFYLQDQESLDLLKEHHFTNTIAAGDTRFDRVIEIAQNPQPIPSVEEFISGKPCLVIGSSWPKDEALLSEYINTHLNYKYILAPHQINESHLKSIEALLPNQTQRYSDYIIAPQQEKTVLIIDNIGMLTSIYQYADLAYIGGAFGTGLHNILEAAVYGIPVIFGPEYSKFQEAKNLVAQNASISISNSKELNSILEKLFDHKVERDKVGQIAKNFIYKSQGAVDLIYSDIFKENLSI